MTIYNSIGHGYAAYRQPDARIAAAIDAALGDAASVVNVGAGAGSYEPMGRSVMAVEPSEVMIRQRPRSAAPCVRGVAEDLPLETASVDAAMAVLTIHHWTDIPRGLKEMARVARKRIVILTWVPDSPPFWLTQEYFPEIVEYDRGIFPSSPRLRSTLAALGGRVQIAPLPIPHDCSDGFLCAYWRRPELYLDSGRRSAISSFARFDAHPGLCWLHEDLESGAWAARHKRLLSLDTIDAGYRVVTCELGAV